MAPLDSRPFHVTISLTLRPLPAQAPVQNPPGVPLDLQRPLQALLRSFWRKLCLPGPDLEGIGTGQPVAVAAQRTRTAWVPAGHLRKDRDILPEHSRMKPRQLTRRPKAERQPHRVRAGLPTKQPSEEWVVPRAVDWCLACLGAQMKSLSPRQRSFPRRNTWLGNGWS